MFGAILVLGGCFDGGGGTLTRGNGVEVILEIEGDVPDVREGETFRTVLTLNNNMKCEVTGEGKIRDNVDNGAFEGVHTKEFNFDIDPIRETSQGLEIDEWEQTFPEDYSDYYYDNIDRYGFDAILTAEVEYRCEDDVGAGPTICQDESRCGLRETIPKSEIKADNLPIVVDAIQKRISKGQFGVRRIILDITLLQKIDGVPYYNEEEAVFIQVDGIGEGMYTCDPEVIEWDGNTGTTQCWLDVTDELNDVITHITLEYDFKASTQVTIKVKNDEVQGV